MRAPTALLLFAFSVLGCSDSATSVLTELDPGVLSNVSAGSITVGAVDGPMAPVAVNVPVQITGYFAGGSGDTHSAVIRWGNGASSVATVTEVDGTGTASAAHLYTVPGVHTVEVEVRNQSGLSAIARYEYVTVYDPAAGYVSGNGAILSPAGACTWSGCVLDENTARFGFSARYHKGATVPDGRTRFTFRAGNFTFTSAEYEWLVIAGARAQYKGVGTVNQQGNYGFILTAVDSDRSGGGVEDRFRIRIWDRDDGDAVVYDNQAGAEDGADLTRDGTRLMQGSVTIRTTASNQAPGVIITSPTDGATFPGNAAILLAANAGDAEDGDISAMVAWSSDVAGPLGTAASVSATLEPGTHVITARVTDSRGLEGSATVTIHVASADLTVHDATVMLRERNGAITESDANGPYCQAIDLSSFVSAGSGSSPAQIEYRLTSFGATGALFPDASCAAGTEFSGTDVADDATAALAGHQLWYAPPLNAASVVTGQEPLDGAWFTFQVSALTDVWSTRGTVTIAVVSTDNDRPVLTWSVGASCIEDGYCEVLLEVIDPDPADTHTITVDNVKPPGLSTLHRYDAAAANHVGEQISGPGPFRLPDGRVVLVPEPNFFGFVKDLMSAQVEDQGGLQRIVPVVWLTVPPADDAPFAANSTISLFPHQIGVSAIPVDVSEGQRYNENDDLEVVITSLPATGVLRVGGAAIVSVPAVVPCGGFTCGEIFEYVLSPGTYTYASVVDAFEVRVRDVVGGGTSEPATISVSLGEPIVTRLLSSSEWSYPEGGSRDLLLTFEGAFETSMWLGVLDWHEPAPASINSLTHTSGVVYASTPTRLGDFTAAAWKGTVELTSGDQIPAVRYAAESCTTYTCTFRVTVRACEGDEPSAVSPCDPDHSGSDVINVAVTTEAGSGTGAFGSTSGAVSTFGLTVDITNDFLDAAPVMPALHPECTPEQYIIPRSGSGFLDSSGNPTTVDFRHLWCDLQDVLYTPKIFGVGAHADGLDVNGQAAAWRMEVTYYRRYAELTTPQRYQRADVPGGVFPDQTLPAALTSLSTTLAAEGLNVTGLVFDPLDGGGLGYGFTADHADLLELRRAVWWGIYISAAVNPEALAGTLPEWDAVQVRLYSRAPGASTWSEHGTEYLLLVHDQGNPYPVVTEPGYYPYPGS